MIRCIDTDDTDNTDNTDDTVDTLATPTRFMDGPGFTLYSLIQLHYLFTLYSFYTLLQTTVKITHYINTNICTHICRYTGNTVYILGTPVLIQHTAHTTLHNFTDITWIICSEL